MADVFDPNMDPEEFAIRQAMSRAAALRKQPAPAQGQMVSGQYVRAPKMAGLVPILNNLVADNIEGNAVQQQQALTARQREALNEWLTARPTAKTTYGASDVGPTMTTTEPTEADTTAWAAQGMKNPLARTLASKVVEDQIVNAPVRAEKAAAKKENTLLVNQRYDEDRKARAQLAAENSKNRLDMLQMRLSTVGADTAARMELQRQIARESNDLRRWQIESGIEQKTLDRQSAENMFDRKLQSAVEKAGSLSPTQKKEIAGLQDEVAQHSGYLATFKDNFSGPKAAVQAQLGGTFLNSDDPEAAETAEWWRNFRAGDNVIRNGLFGSALTAPEKAAWQATTVSPLSSPAQIKAAIAAREKIVKDKFDRRMQLYTEGKIDAPPSNLGSAPGADAPKSALPRATGTRVTPAEQSARNQGQSEVLLSEIRSGSNVANQADYDGLVRELKRTGYKGEIPPMKIGAPGAAPAPKTMKWSDLK
jgi:hypothetical protein